MSASGDWDADRVESLVAEIYDSAAIARVDELREALVAWDPRRHARDRAVAGGAWLVLFKLSHEQEHLSQALRHLRSGWELEPTPSRAANLASALLEWAWLPERTDAAETLDAHREAIGLLERSVEETVPAASVWVTRATTLLGAYADEVEGRLPGYDVDRTLDFGEEVVAAATRLNVGQGEPANLLGGALIVAADLGHPRGDLDTAVALLRDAVHALPLEHPDRPGRLSNLGSALMDRYERTGGPDDRAEAIRCHREAYERVGASDLNRPLIANNLLNALCADIELTGDLDLAQEAAAMAPALASAFGPGHPRRAVILSNAALAQRLVAVLTDDGELLETAVVNQSEAVELTPPDDPSRAGRLASLSVVLGDRYHRGGARADLAAALRAGAEAVNASGAVVHETVGFLSNLANLHHDRFLLTGSIPDLELAGRLHMAGLGALPQGHPITTALQNNAGIALSDRFDRFGAPSDLAAAIDALESALAATAEDGALRAGREVNLAVALARRFSLSGDPDDIRRSSELAGTAHRRAHAIGSSEASSAALGALADSLRLRWEHLEDGEALAELRRLLYEPHVDATPSAAPAHALRRALLRRAVDGAPDRRDLQTAVDLGLEARPAVALAAARQLAADALVDRLRGDAAASRSAHEAAAAATRALDALLADNPEARSELSWRREAQGMAAIAAHVALLDEDPAQALAAFESGHAVLLTQRLPSGEPADVGVADDEVAVTAWTTPWGGGAVVVARGKVIDMLALPALNADRVERWVNRLAMSSRIGMTSVEVVLATVLHEMGDALAPLLAHAAADQPLVWCGGGLLSLLPIAAVEADGCAVGERAALRQATTTAFARWSVARAASGPGLFGASMSIAAPSPSAHPPLPGAERESTYFADPDRRLVGADASAERVAEELPTASLVHFAGHAFTSAADPLANHLLLAGDEPLYAETLADLKASARLAVLSACDTAAIGVAHADEALGLPSAFHLAGVPGVVATLWPVRDGATASFMEPFAAALANGSPPAEALRRARRTARERRLPRSVWAAFVLSGA